MFSFSHWGVFQLTRNAHHHLMDEMTLHGHEWWPVLDKMKYKTRTIDGLIVFCRRSSDAHGGWE
jgi:hypothetical protein